jgi:hypothetical protein
MITSVNPHHRDTESTEKIVSFARSGDPPASPEGAQARDGGQAAIGQKKLSPSGGLFRVSPLASIYKKGLVIMKLETTQAIDDSTTQPF